MIKAGVQIKAPDWLNCFLYQFLLAFWCFAGPLEDSRKGFLGMKDQRALGSRMSLSQRGLDSWPQAIDPGEGTSL